MIKVNNKTNELLRNFSKIINWDMYENYVLVLVTFSGVNWIFLLFTVSGFACPPPPSLLSVNGLN